MSTGTEVLQRSNGGSLLPITVANNIIEKVATESAFLKLMNRQPDARSYQQRVPVMTTAPKAKWLANDIDKKHTSTPTFSDDSMYMEEVAVIIPVSEALIDDADPSDLWGVIEKAGVSSIAEAIDNAIGFGVGKPTTFPDGIVDQAISVGNTVTSTGDFYKDVLAEGGVFSKVEQGNYDVNGVIGANTLKSMIRGATTTTGSLYFQSGNIDGIPTNFSATWDNKKALLIAGDWEMATYAIRKDVTYKVLDQATLTLEDGTLFNLAERDCKALRIVMRLGWFLANPATGVDNRFPFAILTPKTARVKSA